MKQKFTLLLALLVFAFIGNSQTCPDNGSTSPNSSSVRWLGSGLLVINFATGTNGGQTMYDALATSGTAISFTGTVSGGPNDGNAFNLALPKADWTVPGTNPDRIRPVSSSDGNNGSQASFTGNITFTLEAGGTLSCDYLNGVYQAPLPVELMSFIASKNRESIELDWIVASESNNDYFLLERSNNGMEFSEIGRIDGRGNANSVAEYNFEDKNPLPGANYYRLKQVDFSGSFSQSHIVFSKLSTDNNSIRVYPTILNESTILNIDLINSKRSLIEFSIVNINGQFVQRLMLNGGAQNQIDVSNLSEGIYILRTTHDFEKNQFRFILTK